MKPPSKVKNRGSREIKAIANDIEAQERKSLKVSTSCNNKNDDVIYTWIKPDKGINL